MNPDEALSLINEHRAALCYGPLSLHDIGGNPVKYLDLVEEYAQFGNDFWAERNVGSKVYVFGGVQCDDFMGEIIGNEDGAYLVRAEGDPPEWFGPVSYNFLILAEG